MVTLTDTPWSGLETGGTDTRRVDSGHRWDWFWAIMPRGIPALVLRLKEAPTTRLDLPSLRSLEIGFQALAGNSVFFVRLNDRSQVALFETLCRDIVAATAGAESERAALGRAVTRTFRWHHLLRTGKSDLLSESEQVGLIGELAILQLLVDTIGADTAVAAWTGPDGTPKDFELAADLIEVKARRSTSRPSVKINGESQLSDVPGRRAWLAVIPIDKGLSPESQTLSEVVASVRWLVEIKAAQSLMALELLLAKAGYDDTHDYSQWQWSRSEPEFYAIEEGFPRITDPLPVGVRAVTYEIDLTAIEAWRRDWAALRGGLNEGGYDD